MRIFLQLRRHWRKWVVLGILFTTLVMIAYTQREHLSREMLVRYGKALPPGWFVAAYFVMPLAGVPVSVFLVLAGVRFGFWGGMAVAAGGMFFHHWVAFHWVHGWLREPLARRLEGAGYRIPELANKNQGWFTALFAAVHGPPYIAKVYLLALTNVSFRVYFWVGAPVYIFFCVIPVGLGSSAMRVNPVWVYLLVFAITVLPLGTRWLSKRDKYRR